jgi:prepilin-type N-terminal cleavage/methylation domain-containing protein
MRAARRQAGMTMIEVTIAIGILGVMMALAWRTISTASDAARTFSSIQERDHEVRVALERAVLDLQSAYLSQNEDVNATHRRTLFKGRKSGKGVELRFSSLAHRVLWADAKESEQTQILYTLEPDRRDASKTNWMRREQRRLSNENPEDESADKDIMIRGVEEVAIQFWDWKDEKWVDDWDSTGSDSQRNRLPTRAKITVTLKLANGTEYKVSTQARLLLQEALNFIP